MFDRILVVFRLLCLQFGIPLTCACTDQLPGAIERQAAAAIDEAHAVIMVVDGQAGLTGADEEVITWLRRHHPDKPATLAVNKCENSAKADIMVGTTLWCLGCLMEMACMLLPAHC